jgi:hypothetical protein
MKSMIRHIVCCIIIFCHATTVFAGQLAILSSMINSGSEQVFCTEGGNTLPPDTRQYVSQAKFTLPTVTSSIDLTVTDGKLDYHAPEPESIPQCGSLYSMLISHFPYPQFWPRDPSLA